MNEAGETLSPALCKRSRQSRPMFRTPGGISIPKFVRSSPHSVMISLFSSTYLGYMGNQRVRLMGIAKCRIVNQSRFGGDEASLEGNRRLNGSRTVRHNCDAPKILGFCISSSSANIPRVVRVPSHQNGRYKRIHCRRVCLELV